MPFGISNRKKQIVWSFLLFTASATNATRAADLPNRRSLEVFTPPPVFSWTGVYAGLSVGGATAVSRALGSYTGAANAGRVSGAIAGGQVGYNYQISPRFVVGVENDLFFTSLKSNGFYGSRLSIPFFGTGRARAGVTFLDSKVLVYGTAGLAGAQVKDTGLDKLRIGWTAGGGVEWAFQPNWSVKAEYLYTDLYKDFKNNGLAERKERFHTVRVGLNYHFDLFRPSYLSNSGY